VPHAPQPSGETLKLADSILCSRNAGAGWTDGSSSLLCCVSRHITARGGTRTMRGLPSACSPNGRKAAPDTFATIQGRSRRSGPQGLSVKVLPY
jgi:hypothetical protein